MAQFQAQLNAALDEELDDLRERLGLRRNQKADWPRPPGRWISMSNGAGSEAARRAVSASGPTDLWAEDLSNEAVRPPGDPWRSDRRQLTPAEPTRRTEDLYRSFTAETLVRSESLLRCSKAGFGAARKAIHRRSGENKGNRGSPSSPLPDEGDGEPTRKKKPDHAARPLQSDSQSL